MEFSIPNNSQIYGLWLNGTIFVAFLIEIPVLYRVDQKQMLSAAFDLGLKHLLSYEWDIVHETGNTTIDMDR